jgi:hypothetical protein
MRHSLRKRPRLPATRYIPGEARFLRLLDRNTDIVSFALLGNFQQRTVATVLEQPVHQEIWRVGRSARVVPRWMSILGKVIPQTKSVGVCLKDVPNWRNGLFNSASLARILAQTRQVGKWVRMCIDGVQIEKRHQGHLTVSRLRFSEKR